jgi:DNA-binding NarL/FixJ family response regulator
MLTSSPIRIVVADDHPVVRRGLTALIEDAPDMCVIGSASNGREAVALYADCRPDVMLVDLRMPELDGVGAITAILRQDAGARLIVLTTYDGDEDIYRGLMAGAKAYLLKDVPPEELLATIRAVQAGKTCLSPLAAAKLAERMRGPSLTPRELEVLRLLVAGRSNKEIEAILDISPGTVKAHIAHILDKLDAEDRTQAVTTALKRGLVRLE